MTKFGTPRLALIASAAALVLAACTDSPDVATEPSTAGIAISKPSNDFGIAAAALIQVCIDPASAAGPYTVTFTTPTDVAGADITQPLTQNNVAVGSAGCRLLFQKNAYVWQVPGTVNWPEQGWQGSNTAVTVAHATISGGTYSYTCITPQDANFVNLCRTGTPVIENPPVLFNGNPITYRKTGTGPTATLGANPYHGSQVIFKFVPPVATECTLGYPDASNTPRSQYSFNESEVLRAYAYDAATKEVRAWYNDEHALLLGQRQNIYKYPAPTGTIIANHGFATMVNNPASQIGGPAGLIAVGSAQLSGDGAATDGYGRPLFPAVFITDITPNPLNREGDWQQGGTAYRPNKIFGTWKGVVATTDFTRNPAKTTFVTDNNPAKNNNNLGVGSDPAPAGTPNQGYGTEIVWTAASLGLDATKNWRLQFMVHDGDQNKTGGDVGQACMNIGPNVADRLVKNF